MNIYMIKFFFLACSLAVQVQATENYNNLPPLISAIVLGEYRSAENIINIRGRVNVKFNGSPELIFAISPICRPEFVKLLLEYGADPNSKEDDTGTTPMLEALSQGNLACVDLLLESGGNIHLSDNNGAGAIYKAVQSGSLQLVAKVFSMGAELDKARNDGTTALMYAARAGMYDIARFLVENGADECRRNDRGATVSWLAKLSENKDVIDLLSKSCK